jgi:hypothetical protein
MPTWSTHVISNLVTTLEILSILTNVLWLLVKSVTSTIEIGAILDTTPITSATSYIFNYIIISTNFEVVNVIVLCMWYKLDESKMMNQLLSIMFNGI